MIRILTEEIIETLSKLEMELDTSSYGIPFICFVDADVKIAAFLKVIQSTAYFDVEFLKSNNIESYHIRIIRSIHFSSNQYYLTTDQKKIFGNSDWVGDLKSIIGFNPSSPKLVIKESLEFFIKLISFKKYKLRSNRFYCDDILSRKDELKNMLNDGFVLSDAEFIEYSKNIYAFDMHYHRNMIFKKILGK